MKNRKVWVVILAGGDGRRLGSLTKNAQGVSTPKQYCSLDGGASLLQLSLRRALGLTIRERIVPVVLDAHRQWWRYELFSWQRSTLVVQPSNRGTGLGILMPLLVIAKKDPDAAVICIPSDHYVEKEEVLAETLRQAISPQALEGGKLTLLGVSPNAPDSGFGYVCPCPNSGVGMRPVQSFVEKPDEATAKELIRGGSLVSTGIVAGLASQILSLYPHPGSGLMWELKSIIEQYANLRQCPVELTSLYARYPLMDFSRDILATHPELLQMLEVPPCGWSDIGTPARLASTLWSLRARKPASSVPGGSSAFNLAASGGIGAYPSRREAEERAISSTCAVATRDGN